MSRGSLAPALGRAALSGLATVLPPPSGPKPLWLFGGASGRSYSDNARVVHEFVVRERAETDACWVIDRNSPDVALIAGDRLPLERNRFSTHRLTRTAEVIVFSHGIHDVPGLMLRRQAVRVRLGHGLTAFNETKGRTPRSVKRMTSAVDLAPVASEMERAHKADWGFPESSLPITGLPRWDAMLAARAAHGPRQRPLVLYTPTSRPWHTAADASPDGALAPVHELLSSPRLRAMLADGAFELAVYFHQITRFRFGTFDWLPPGVRVIDQEAVLPELISTASLVVSDYSSILWDALYLDTPVAFFQFDRDEHLNHRGSYLDFDAPLFGPNVDTAAQLLDVLEQAVADDFTLAAFGEQRQRWQQRAFAYRDAGNAERVVAAIEERLGDR